MPKVNIQVDERTLVMLKAIKDYHASIEIESTYESVVAEAVKYQYDFLVEAKLIDEPKKGRAK